MLYTEQGLLLDYLYNYCRNKDGSYNRIKYKNIFKSIKYEAENTRNSKKKL